MEEEEEEKMKISRKPSDISSLETSDQVMNEISNLRYSHGSSLDANTNRFMESRFRYDFSKVKIHTDETADLYRLTRLMRYLIL